MSTAISKQQQNAIRFALGEVWSQNFKLFPAGAGWAICLFLLMNYPSFLVKIPALLALNFISLYSAAMLNRTRLPLLGKKLLAIYLGVDIFILVCLHNVIYFAHAPESTKLVLVSNFCVSFIILAFLSVPLATLITMKSDRPVELSEFARRSSKRTMVFAVLVIAVGWLTIFPYIFFGLPFAQLLMIGSTRRVQS